MAFNPAVKKFAKFFVVMAVVVGLGYYFIGKKPATKVEVPATTDVQAPVTSAQPVVKEEAPVRYEEPKQAKKANVAVKKKAYTEPVKHKAISSKSTKKVLEDADQRALKELAGGGL